MVHFLGFLLPGVSFCLLAVNRIFHCLYRFIKCAQSHQTFQSSLVYASSHRCRGCSVESLLKILLSLLFMVAFAVAAAMDSPNSFYKQAVYLQALTMCIFFSFSGLVDMILSCNRSFWLPPGVDYAAFILALLSEGIVVTSLIESDHRKLFICLFSVLRVIVVVSMFCAGWDMINRGALASLLNSGCLFLQGTWLCQIGYCVSSEDWIEKKLGASIVYMTALWHILLISSFILLAAAFVRCYLGPQKYQAVDPAMQRLIHKDENGKTVVAMDESDSEIEWEAPLPKK